MKKLRICLFLITFIAISMSVAPAQTVKIAPDGVGVLDSATGLEWLPLTATAGFSYNQVIAGADSNIPTGYQVATTTQVGKLLVDAGLPNRIVHPLPGVNVNGGGSLAVPIATAFGSLFGYTTSSTFHGAINTQTAGNAIFSGSGSTATLGFFRIGVTGNTAEFDDAGPEADDGCFTNPTCTQVNEGEYMVAKGLYLRAGFGTDDTSTSTQASLITSGTQKKMTIPLGRAFFIQYLSGTVVVESKYSLSVATVSPAVGDPTDSILYPSNVLLAFTGNDATDIFQPIHEGTVSLTITPTDTTYSPVTVTVSVVPPARLGNDNNDIDATLVMLAHRRGIPPQLIKGQIKQESILESDGITFDPNSYRYEPLSSDLLNISDAKIVKVPSEASPGSTVKISTGQDLRLSNPYSLYRLATATDTSDGALAQGSNILPADISPRNVYSIVVDGVTRNISDSDTLVSSANIFTTNDDIQNWSAVANQTTADYIANNPLVLNFTAQTPTASSYGYLQLLYSTALSPLHWTGVLTGDQNPFFLFDSDDHGTLGGGSLELGTNYFTTSSFPTSSNASFSEPSDFTDAFVAGFNLYNHRKPTGAYGNNVLRKSNSYTPVASSKIFTK